MPEIKHNFTAGKMNKDLDERLVPNGEHRDAMNVQISNSDGSEVGTIQNLLGNSLVDNITFITQDAVCIATIANEKNDSLFWFVHDVSYDYIIRYNKITNQITPVVVDLLQGDEKVLNFSNKIITGINIIDNLLFWTDGSTEPKKINIDRCIEGTDPSGLVHTEVFVRGVSKGQLNKIDALVITPAPKQPLALDFSRLRDLDRAHTGIIVTSENDGISNSFIDSSKGIIHDFSSLEVGDYFSTIIDTDIELRDEFNLSWQEGTKVVLKPFTDTGQPPSIPITNFTIKGFITDWIYNEFSNTVEEITQRDTQVGQSSGTDGWFEDEDDRWESTNDATSRKYYIDTVDGPDGEPLRQTRQYRVRYTIEEDTSSVLEGRLTVRLHDKDNNYIEIREHGDRDPSNPLAINTPLVAGDYEFIVDDWNNFSPNTTWSGTNYDNSLLFESKASWDDTAGSYTGPAFHGIISNATVERIDAQVAKVEVEITAIDGIPKTVEPGNGQLKYAIDAYQEEEGIFETKFPRFSYRYRYADGELSPFAPFTKVAFLPGNYKFDSVIGHNTGMTNTYDKVILKNINKNIPKQVVSVDLLYKEDGSTTIYLIETLKGSIPNKYTITSEMFNGAIASNQILRPWDAVPKSAVSQEIVGNRIIYGNYKQNYDLINSENDQDFQLDLNSKVISTQHDSNMGMESVKSLREYNLGVVYTDEYGRETPVITSADSSVKLEKTASDDINKIVVRIKTFGHPLNMKYFKFYIKDNGGEYYNMPMDRYYDGEDGNIWLAFPSVDRNKVTIDDFIVLKKGVDDNSLIKEQAKYKIIDIQNEAPDYIKRNDTLVSSKRHADSNLLFDKIPKENSDNFEILKNRYTDHLASLNTLYENRSENGEKWKIKFHNTITNLVSKEYTLQNWGAGSGNTWSLQIEGEFGEEVNDFGNNPNNPTKITNNTYLNIYKEVIDNSPIFDGRFFVKIYRDETFNKVVQPAINSENEQYRKANISSGASRKLYYAVSDESSSTNAVELNGALNGSDHGLFEGYDTYSAAADFPMGRSSTEPFDDASANLADWVDARIACIEDLGDFEYNNGGKASGFTGTHSVQMAWHGYFRGINTDSLQRFTVGADSSDVGRTSQLDLETDRENTKFEDVWFISEVRPSIKQSRSGLGLKIFSNQPAPQDVDDDGDTVGDGLDFANPGMGITNYSAASVLEISFGGIEPEEWPRDETHPKNFSNWYDIEGGNGNYAATQGGFAKAMAIGSQFRFKEDPTSTVYTITDVAKYQNVIYDNLQEEFNQTPPTNVNHYKGQLQCIKGNRSTVEINSVQYRASSFFDASNFTVSYRLSLDKPITWNPVELASSFGIITGGSDIKLLGSQAAPVVTSGTGGTISIEVDTITGIDSATNEEKQVSVGMVLESFDDNGSGGTNTVFGSATLHAVVTRIEFDSGTGKHTLFFRSNDNRTNNLDNHFASLAAADDLHFKQASMNGMSPNSAKNLNYFNNAGEAETDCGVAPIGYTFEFVEPEQTRPQDQVLPVNPAVWETEPKEVQDVDIYYEASGAIPIVVEKEDLADFIPVGSKIEHYNSNIVPEGTTITNIDSNGEITLSNEVLIDRANLPQPAPLFDAF